MSDQAIAERVDLDKKDKSELQAIVVALGGKASSRLKKAELIDTILELSGVTSAGSDSGASDSDGPDSDSPDSESADSGSGSEDSPKAASSGRPVDSSFGAPVAVEPEADETAEQASAKSTAEGSSDETSSSDSSAETSSARRDSSDTRGAKRGRGRRRPDEPPAEWETAIAEDQGGGSKRSGSNSGQSGSQPSGSQQSGNQQSGNQQSGNQQGGNQQSGNQQSGSQQSGNQQSGSQQSGNQQSGNQQSGNQQSGSQQGRNQQGGGQRGNQGRNQSSAKAKDGNDGRSNQGGNQPDGNQQDSDRQDGGQGDDTESGNRRRRRRGRGRERDDNVEPISSEPIAVAGHLDLRDDGYGFLRVNGHLPSTDDVYVPVKMARQYGLRKGDLVAGTARPANRNEKNPALQQLESINGLNPEEARDRPNFDELTPLFADERLRLERTRQPLDLTARVIDLISPIGKGQRGLIVSPPKAGKTTIMKEIASSLEANHPEVELIVLLVDERPEEVTDMRRHLERGEVVASTFDRPTEEHCALAELTIERAKRMVETGKDVVIILDGITRLARAYNMSANGTGRVMSGGVDAGALYPPKKFLGAARNLEEGGSLTILATALVETGSRMDEVIFEEFKGTGNMELRLDRSLAERYIFPAIDALGSSTRRDELLMDGREHQSAMKLRKVLAGMSSGEDGAAAASMNLLMDRLKTFKTNDEFLKEIAKS